MSSIGQSILASLPNEILSLIWGYIFLDLPIAFRRRDIRGPLHRGNLSILFTCKHLYRDLSVREALRKHAILVLRNKNDWIRCVQRILQRSEFERVTDILTRRVRWEVPAEVVLSAPWFNLVTHERILEILLNLIAFEVDLQHHVAVLYTWSGHKQSTITAWPAPDLQGNYSASNIIYECRTTQHWDRDENNADFSRIWSAVRERAYSNRVGHRTELTLKCPMLHDIHSTEFARDGWYKQLALYLPKGREGYRVPRPQKRSTEGATLNLENFETINYQKILLDTPVV